MSTDKPFTETLELDGFAIEPSNYHHFGKLVGGLFLSDVEGEIILLCEEARALYEYLKRHFEGEQSDRERLVRFADFIQGRLVKMGTIGQIIDEFLKSDEGK